MNDSPGREPPGSSPADQPEQGPSGEGDAPEGAEAAEPPDGSRPPDRPSAGAGPGSAPGARWAERQPPRGQWPAPWGTPDHPSGPSGRNGSAGPAGSGGWGAGWAQPPPAAKPGTVPLRPLRVGEIIDGALATLRLHWRTALTVSLAVALVSQFLITTVTGLWLQDTSGLEALENDPEPTAAETLDALGGSLGTTGATMVIGMLGTLAGAVLLAPVVSAAVLGRPTSTRETWRAARGRLPRLCGLVVLVPLLVVGAFAAWVAPGLLVVAVGASRPGATLALLGALPGSCAAIWLWVRFSLAAPALVLEKQSVRSALRRSTKLVRGAWWRVFGIQLLALAFVFVVNAVIEIPASAVGMTLGGDSAMEWLAGESSAVGWPFLVVIGIGGTLSMTLTLPITAGVTTLLYVDQRIRREALDLELARAAGVRS
ncbi:glycerophosphoryl diester phosphodiesterase membrane domain-containing protein [Streptomyces sp. SAJ15]|uniref:glycerophosphoryl diester phosphodiesterase membrane domain-containing protein n=1 Tax=Streptomyces sp. SAJ15 TaxID=2011095 RepID=UPI0011866142|nr:glycerophosphoryl diester phosphodiesterase membrane domain-containing protein [Streptomyces sp. SAJ15]TVL89093.1 hypothetical protein CD790_28250 [Streptomyces sp. SAJ15]